MRVLILNEAQETGYHYTDVNGLVAILKANTMKATNPERFGTKKSKSYLVDTEDYEDYTLADMIDRLKDRIDYYKGEYDYIKLPSDKQIVKWKEKKYLDKTVKNLIKKKIFDNEMLRLIHYLQTHSKKDFADKQAQSHNEMDGYKPTWSFTRSSQPLGWMKEVQKYGTLILFGAVRIYLDIEAIANNQKRYKFKWHKAKEDEQEERVQGDTKDFIRFIKAIDFPQELEDRNKVVFLSKSGSRLATYEDFISNNYTVVSPISIVNRLLQEGLNNFSARYSDKKVNSSVKSYDKLIDYISKQIEKANKTVEKEDKKISITIGKFSLKLPILKSFSETDFKKVERLSYMVDLNAYDEYRKTHKDKPNFTGQLKLDL